MDSFQTTILEVMEFTWPMIEHRFIQRNLVSFFHHLHPLPIPSGNLSRCQCGNVQQQLHAIS